MLLFTEFNRGLMSIEPSINWKVETRDSSQLTNLKYLLKKAQPTKR
jgi:hypothetical protein